MEALLSAGRSARGRKEARPLLTSWRHDSTTLHTTLVTGVLISTCIITVLEGFSSYHVTG